MRDQIKARNRQREVGRVQAGIARRHDADEDDVVSLSNAVRPKGEIADAALARIPSLILMLQAIRRIRWLNPGENRWPLVGQGAEQPRPRWNPRRGGCPEAQRS